LRIWIFFGPSTSTPQQASSKELVLTADKGYGLQVSAAFVRKSGQVILEMTLFNQSSVSITQVGIIFNKNSFGLTPTGVQLSVPAIMQGQTVEATANVSVNPNQQNLGPANNLIQTALKATFQGQGDKVLYFQVPIQFQVLFIENGRLERDEYLRIWKGIAEEHFKDVNIGMGLKGNADAIVKKFETNRLFFIARTPQQVMYFSAKIQSDVVLLLELSSWTNNAKICVKAYNTELVPLFHQTVQTILA